MLKFLKKALTWWQGQTLNTQFHTWLYGEKMGEDSQGNVYYRSHKGDRRWVIFNGETEASKVDVHWHGWLHHTFDAVPADSPLKQPDWAKAHQENLTGTPYAYAPRGSLRSKAHIPSDYEAWRPR